MTLIATATLLVLTAAAFWAGRRRAFVLASGATVRLHSRPAYHGALVALACATPGLVLLPVAPRLALLAAAALGGLAWTRLTPALRARPAVETVVRVFFAGCSLIAIVATIGIVLSLVFEATNPLTRVAPCDD